MKNYLSDPQLKAVQERGAVVLEFSLISGIFFFALLALFDFTRYYSLQATITKGAQNGLEVAKVIDGLRIDLQDLSMDCNQNPATLPACQAANLTRLENARLEVVNAATRFPLATFASRPSTGGNFELNEYEFTDFPAGTTLPQLAATVIRPGETVFNKTKGTTIEHPQICPINSTNCTGNRRPRQATESLEGLYRTFPIVVQVQAEFKPLFPFWKPIPMVGKAVGYRELNTGSVPSDLPPLLACQTPPTCGANQVPNSSCGCDCTNNCPTGQIPNPATCDCECNTGQTCPTGSGQVINPTTCACACPTGAPTDPTDCNTTGQRDARWNVANCQCVCPGDIDEICLTAGKRYNRSTCSCHWCAPGDRTCAGTCATSKLAAACARLDPPQGIDSARCECANECVNPVPCTGGTRTSCTTCYCPDNCPGAKKPDTRNGICGECVCPSNTEAGQGCPPERPNANQYTCLCEAPGGGPAS